MLIQNPGWCSEEEKCLRRNAIYSNFGNVGISKWEIHWQYFLPIYAAPILVGVWAMIDSGGCLR